MIIVKVSLPSHWDYKVHLSSPEEKSIWREYKFIVTPDKIKCDFWIILGDLDSCEEAICPTENIIYFTDEAYDEKQYNQAFLDQYGAVVTSREDIFHQRVLITQYICGWFLRKNHDFLNNLKISHINKTDVLSTVCSNQLWLEGHKNRFAFINKMIGHFKNRLNVFGRGFNPIEDKYDALINYQYSIAIENSVHKRYFSEKITDCFLTYTMPIYYGCSNILDYFPEESMLLIDIHDYLGSIEKIEEAIANKRFEKNFDFIVDARNEYFKMYHPLEAISQVLDSKFESDGQTKVTRIFPMQHFMKNDTAKGISSRIKNKLSRLFP